MLGQYDIQDVGAYAHHLFISDNTGNAVVVEWKGNEMRVVRDQSAATNFQLGYTADKSLYKGKCSRFDKMIDWFSDHSTTTSEQAMDVLEVPETEQAEYMKKLGL